MGVPRKAIALKRGKKLTTIQAKNRVARFDWVVNKVASELKLTSASQQQLSGMLTQGKDGVKTSMIVQKRAEKFLTDIRKLKREKGDIKKYVWKRLKKEADTLTQTFIESEWKDLTINEIFEFQRDNFYAENKHLIKSAPRTQSGRIDSRSKEGKTLQKNRAAMKARRARKALAVRKQKLTGKLH